MVVNTWKDYKESHKNLIMCRRFRYISMILLSTLHFSFCDKNCVVVIVDVVVLFAIIIFFLLALLPSKDVGLFYIKDILFGVIDWRPAKFKMADLDLLMALLLVFSFAFFSCFMQFLTIILFSFHYGFSRNSYGS